MLVHGICDKWVGEYWITLINPNIGDIGSIDLCQILPGHGSPSPSSHSVASCGLSLPPTLLPYRTTLLVRHSLHHWENLVVDVWREVPAINSDYETDLISCCSKMERLKFIEELNLFSISRSDENTECRLYHYLEPVTGCQGTPRFHIAPCVFQTTWAHETWAVLYWLIVPGFSNTLAGR